MAANPEATFGVALLGFGFAGHTFHAPFIATTPGLALRVVASSQTARVATEYPDVRVVPDPIEAIQQDDVVLVVVATPNETHAPLAEAAMRGVAEVLDEPAPQALLQGVGSATVRMDLRFWSGARQMETRLAQHQVIVAVLRDLADADVVTGTDVLVVEGGPGLLGAIRPGDAT